MKVEITRRIDGKRTEPLKKWNRCLWGGNVENDGVDGEVSGFEV